jgi:hypothetical protein
MSWAAVTLALYGRVLRQALELMRKNWPVAGVLFVYSAVMSVAAAVAVPFGIIGGLLLSVVWAACVGSFLYLIEMIVRTGRVSGADLRRSAGAYLGDVLGVTFVLWVVFALAGPILRGLPQGGTILLLVGIGVLVFFNAVPELIYLGRSSSLELLVESSSSAELDRMVSRDHRARRLHVRRRVAASRVPPTSGRRRRAPRHLHDGGARSAILELRDRAGAMRFATACAIF